MNATTATTAPASSYRIEARGEWAGALYDRWVPAVQGTLNSGTGLSDAEASTFGAEGAAIQFLNETIVAGECGGAPGPRTEFRIVDSDGVVVDLSDWNIDVGDGIVAGEGDGRDAGRVAWIAGDRAYVAWLSGVSTWLDLDESVEVYTSLAAAVEVSGYRRTAR